MTTEITFNRPQEIPPFLRRNNLKATIAFVGGAPGQSTADQEEKIRNIIHGAIAYFATYPVALISNGTEWGVPKYTCQFGLKYSLPIIRIFPVKAKKYLLPETFALDISVGSRFKQSEWGDDTEVLIKAASGIIIIGGGRGTLIECLHWIKIND